MAKSANIKLYNLQGESEKELGLPASVVEAKVNPKLLTQSVRVYLHNQRQGTVSTKTRSEVIGSTKKIYRQKGTGRARHGDIKAPIFVGGGIAHGPKPKTYSLTLTKKQRHKALIYALNVKAGEKNILALENDIVKIQPKTKIFFQLLKKLQLDQIKTLFVLSKIELNNLLRAGNNLKNVNFIDVNSLNAYELLSHEKIVFVEEALVVLQSKLK